MADSIEQKLIDAVIARIELIDGTGSYLTSIGVTTEDSRPNWAEEALPATSVFQGTVETEPYDDEDRIVLHTMPVAVKTSLPRLDTAGEDAAFARKAMADIYRALRGNYTWIVDNEPLAISTDEKRHGIEYAPDSFEITGVQVEIEIKYIAQKFDLES